MLALKPITGSSALAAYAYDPATLVFSVQFQRSFFRHDYLGVTPELVAEFEAAESKGKFFHARIRDRFDHTRIDTSAGDDAVAEPAMQGGFTRIATLLCLFIVALLFACAAQAQNTVTTGNTQVQRGSTTLATVPGVDLQACYADLAARAPRTDYGCRVQVVTTAPPPAPTPSVTLGATPGTVQPGQSSTLNWSSANVSSCAAGGSWNGAKPTSGSEVTAALTATSTFSLTCTGANGSANASATVTVQAAGSITGLDFPSNGQTTSDIRLRFTGAALQPIYPATYIWRVMPRQQTGYHTTMFWSTEGNTFYWDGGNANTYYGAHPYPTGGTHKWEIAVNAGDFTESVSGASTVVQFGRWHIQALRVWSDSSGKHHEFYWDLPDTTKVIRRDEPASYGNTMPAQPAVTFGDAPWNKGNERLSGVLRGLQLYSTTLTVSDIVAEVNAPLSTSAGATNVWYLNLNPTPSDVTDKSGKGHHPSWSSSARPGLWQQ